MSTIPGQARDRNSQEGLRPIRPYKYVPYSYQKLKQKDSAQDNRLSDLDLDFKKPIMRAGS